MKKEDIYEWTPDEFITYYLRPDYDIKNKDNLQIINAISSMYKTLRERTKITLKETYIACNKVMYFTILMQQNNVDFYISIPKDYDNLIYGKLRTVWKKSEITKAELKEIPGQALTGELYLEDYNFKSLDQNTGNLYPLTNMLNLIKSLKEGEEVRVTMVIEPTNKLNWLEKSKIELEDYKKGKRKTNSDMSSKAMEIGIKTITAAMETMIEFQLFKVQCILGAFMDIDTQSEELKKNKKGKRIEVALQNENIDYGSYTKYKLNADVFKVSIFITSFSLSENRNKQNLLSVANAYRDLDNDNKLALKIYTTNQANKIIKALNKQNISPNKNCILCDKEVAKLIQLPQKDLQKEYKLNAIDTKEMDVPKELLQGKIRAGITTKQGKEYNTYLEENIDTLCSCKVINGGQGSGKTTLLMRMIKDFYKAGRSNFILDAIEDCKIASAAKEIIPSKDRLVIRIGDTTQIPALAYTEISKLIKEDMPVAERERLANMIADQVEYLINSIITDSTDKLTAPMLKFLYAACMVTFIRPVATFNDLFNVLQDYKIRAKAVAYAQKSRVFRLNDPIFNDLKLLDKEEKGKVVGTRSDLIIGITNRITMLQKNYYTKRMLSAAINTKEDFGELIEQGKTIIIEIPQYLFTNPTVRDIIITFYLTRLWLTVQIRHDNKHAKICNMVIDEVGTIKTASNFIANHVTEFRRHRLSSLFACHYLNQFGNLLEALKSSGTSYILLAGTEKTSFQALKEELEPFTVEDGLHLKEWHSLNIIRHGNEYVKFISRQPEN